MGREWRTRTDPIKSSPAQLGSRFQKGSTVYPYGARRRGSGMALAPQERAPQERSVDSMKKPGGSGWLKLEKKMKAAETYYKEKNYNKANEVGGDADDLAGELSEKGQLSLKERLRFKKWLISFMAKLKPKMKKQGVTMKITSAPVKGYAPSDDPEYYRRKREELREKQRAQRPKEIERKIITVPKGTSESEMKKYLK